MKPKNFMCRVKQKAQSRFFSEERNAVQSIKITIAIIGMAIGLHLANKIVYLLGEILTQLARGK